MFDVEMIEKLNARKSPFGMPKATVVDTLPTQVKFTKQCSVSGDAYTVRVTASQVRRWLAGEPIQRAMPLLSADDREFIKSGATPAEWDQAFGDMSCETDA